MGMSGEDIIDLGFLVALLTLVPAAALYAHRGAKRRFAEAVASLDTRGYARTPARQSSGGPVTWLWSRFPDPVPIYLRVSNRDRVEALAGRLGVNDIEIGERAFDDLFVVRSNHPEIARRLLDAETRARLLGYRDIDFLTGAIGNLLTPDYWPKQRRDRDLRTLWMLRIGGDLSDRQCEPYLALARSLARRILEESARGRFGPEDLRVGRWEGR